MITSLKEMLELPNFESRDKILLVDRDYDVKTFTSKYLCLKKT